MIDTEKCNPCSICVNVCPEDVFYGSPPKEIPTVAYPDECFHCAGCVTDCPFADQEAGERAAGFAREKNGDDLDTSSEETIRGRRELWSAMLAWRGPRTATWKDAQAAMQSTTDYYASRNRSETMLEAGLSRLRRLREDASAELAAQNPHELYRCVEILSLMDSAEMIMVSAQAHTREPVRPEHRRADFPDTDKGWYCNTGLRREKKTFVTYKKPFNHIYTKETH